MKGRLLFCSLAVSLAITSIAANSILAQQTRPAPSAPTSTALLQEEGVLEQGDTVLASDGSVYDQYTFEGEEGQSITIALQSTEFDTYLVLVSPEGEVLGQNDDVSQTDRNSAITTTLPATGTYTVIANGYDRSSLGRYSISVTVNSNSPAQ